MWKLGKTIGDREGRMDVCIAAAGVLKGEMPCLTYPEKQFKEVSCQYSPAQHREMKRSQQVLDVNVNGVLFTAQAAGQQMERFGNGGSIIMIASICGHGGNQVSRSLARLSYLWVPKLSSGNQGHTWTSYNTSKSAVLQMARSMACELGPQRIRVNTISPAFINTRYVPSTEP